MNKRTPLSNRSNKYYITICKNKADKFSGTVVSAENNNSSSKEYNSSTGYNDQNEFLAEIKEIIKNIEEKKIENIFYKLGSCEGVESHKKHQFEIIIFHHHNGFSAQVEVDSRRFGLPKNAKLPAKELQDLLFEFENEIIAFLKNDPFFRDCFHI